MQTLPASDYEIEKVKNKFEANALFGELNVMNKAMNLGFTTKCSAIPASSTARWSSTAPSRRPNDRLRAPHLPRRTPFHPYLPRDTMKQPQLTTPSDISLHAPSAARSPTA